jgi:hypothetical protein
MRNAKEEVSEDKVKAIIDFIGSIFLHKNIEDEFSGKFFDLRVEKGIGDEKFSQIELELKKLQDTK